MEDNNVRFKFKEVPNNFRIRINGHMKKMKPGDIIECHPDYLRKHIELFDRLDPEPPPPKPKYELKMVACEGGWNVINQASGKPINNVPLSEKDATAMIQHDFDIVKFKAKQKEKEVKGGSK